MAPAPDLPWVHHTDPDQLAVLVADHAAARLTALLDAQQTVVFAVSGGSTPLRFFRALSQRALAWDRVVITLVDDRAVAWDNPRSNTILVRQNLLQNASAQARFVPLTEPDGTPTDQLDWPGAIDLAHFGMGSDGHTASWFPGGDRLDEALSETGPERLPMRAAGAPEARITFSWAALRQASSAFLHFEGAAKATTIRDALAPGPVQDLPVRRLLRQNQVPITVFTDRSRPETLS